MGYANYTVYRNGEEIEAGYGVEDVCNKDGCTQEIDRGLDALCGATPGGDEHGCGFYFCGSHLFCGPDAQQCEECRAKANRRRNEEFIEELAQAIGSMDGVEVAEGFPDELGISIVFEDGRELPLKAVS